MLTLQQAADKMRDKMDPVKGVDMEKYYVIYAVPKGANKNDPYDDSLFAVDKQTGKIFEYSPEFEMDKFARACSKAVSL